MGSMCAFIPLSIVICMINVYGAVSSNPKAFLSHYTIYKEACHKMGFVRKGCKNTELTRKIAFMAMRTNNVRISRGATVPFETVITNEGNAYKRQTSTFTAPVAGNYFFSLSVGMPTPRRFKDYYRIHITKNNKPTSYIFIAPTGKWECAQKTSSCICREAIA